MGAILAIRAYYFRNHRVTAQTKDHSVLQTVDAGYLTQENMRRRRTEQPRRLQEENFEPTIIMRLHRTGDVFLPAPTLLNTSKSARWKTHARGGLDRRGMVEDDGAGGRRTRGSARTPFGVAVWCSDAPMRTTPRPTFATRAKR
jgi:hypothetical protein